MSYLTKMNYSKRQQQAPEPEPAAKDLALGFAPENPRLLGLVSAPVCEPKPLYILRLGSTQDTYLVVQGLGLKPEYDFQQGPRSRATVCFEQTAIMRARAISWPLEAERVQ